jgi:hypothetical protein
VPLGPGEALPGHQEGRLNSRENGERGSFARYTKPIAKLLLLKTQAKGINPCKRFGYWLFKSRRWVV